MPSNRERRETIRQTWAKTDLLADYKMKRIFILGIEHDNDHNVTHEAEEFGDILQADFGENFHNLTYKDYFFLSWFESQSCQTKWVKSWHTDVLLYVWIFRFVFKGDDDILLNTFLLKQLLGKYDDHVNEPFMMGSVLRNSPRVTDKSSKENGGLYPNWNRV